MIGVVSGLQGATKMFPLDANFYNIMFTNIDDSDQMIPVGTFRSGPSVARREREERERDRERFGV